MSTTTMTTESEVTDEVLRDPPISDDLQERWEAAASTGWPRRRAFRPRNVVIAVVAAVVIAVLVLAGVTIVHQRRINEARHSALAAATVDAKLIGTFRYQDVSQDLKAVENNATGSFASQYVKAQSTLVKLLTQYKANSVGSVVSVAIKSVSPHKAVALAFINQSVTNSAVGSTAKTEPDRAIITLVKPGSRWLISAVQIV